MIFLTNAGKNAVTELLSEQSYFFAWGRGKASESGDTSGDANSADSDWTEAEITQLEQTALSNEISRKRIMITGFVIPDEAGDIAVPVGASIEKYSRSLIPTSYLYLKVNYDFAEDNNQIVREYGVFMNCQVSEGLPAGQQYFSPAEIIAGGDLLNYCRLANPINKTADTRQSFEFVLPILGV